jgi:hypothetical protein
MTYGVDERMTSWPRISRAGVNLRAVPADGRVVFEQR